MAGEHARNLEDGATHGRPRLAVVRAEQKPRYGGGWRAGKPTEDPEKVKRWGFVSAKPSEFLIRMRRGQVVTSGQGATCFKWPWDSVAIVPTSVQRLQFEADQVTSEKVGVRVHGLAVYRIAAPLIAFRMMNFSFPERASEKLEGLLGEMFVGAARRLVANLSVEEVLTRRKESLGAELMREISPVVSGTGRAGDHTDKGWGVVLDTIEIQDVRVLSQSLFESMQARFRQEQQRQAREAELAREQAVRQSETEAQREHQLSSLRAQEEVRARKQAAEEQARLEALAAKARIEGQQLANERAMAQARIQAEIEHTRLRAEAEVAAHETELWTVAHQRERVEAEATLLLARRALAEEELALAELEARKGGLTQQLEVSRLRAMREIENTLSPERIQLVVAQQLPAMAQAFQQKMGQVNITSIDGANPFGYMASAIEAVVGIARSAGVKMPKAPPVPGDR